MNTVLCPYNAVLHIRIEFTFAGSSITARIRIVRLVLKSKLFYMFVKNILQNMLQKWR